jgi:glycerol-3-phosphate dehydrogenase
MNVSGMARGSKGITAVTATDVETGCQYTLEGKAIFNACGVWVDAIRRLVDPNASRLVRTSRGSHILVDLAFMPAAAGMLIAKTRDGRVLFAIPWHGQLLIGTTDVEQKDPSFRPEATEDEIGFIIETAAGYLARPIRRSDVKATFSGLRPLFDPAATGSAGSTAKVSREHAVIPEFGNLITVTGGKWTTYRKMALDAIGAASGLGLLPQRDCITETLRLSDDATVDAARVEAAALADPAAADIEAFTRHARDFEGARTVEDVLHRRVRLGQLDAAVTAALADRVKAALAAA